MNDTHTEDVETLLSRFRNWLEVTRIEAGNLDPHGDGPDRSEDVEGSATDFGLIGLAEEFTALRHELKLQTKSGRGLLEQAEAMVVAMRQAIEQFRSVEPKESQAAWASGKPLAEALGDLHEALDRGRNAIEKAGRRLIEEPTQLLTDALDRQFRAQSWIRRRMTRGYHLQALGVVQDAIRARRELFDSILEGYGLIQNRLGRVMKSERIERISCEGNPVDPERMIVIEVVEDENRPPGTVVKELRSGYTWKGRLLRYAEVQAASALRVSASEPVDDAPVPGSDGDHGESEPLEGEEIEKIDIDGDGEDDGDPGIDLGFDIERNDR